MTRVLDFSGPRAPKRFQLLWTALMAAGDGKGERSPAVIRKEARLQDVLESISIATPRPNGGEPERTFPPPKARRRCFSRRKISSYCRRFHRENPMDATSGAGRHLNVGIGSVHREERVNVCVGFNGSWTMSD